MQEQKHQYELRIKKKAKKALESLPLKVKNLIEEKIRKLAFDPFGMSEGGPMEGFKNRYKFRQGSWRVIYEIDNDEIIVEVIKIGARGDVYKDGGG